MKDGLWIHCACVWQRYHMNHHFRIDDKGFGITSTFWDRVFGTLPPAKAAEKSRWFYCKAVENSPLGSQGNELILSIKEPGWQGCHGFIVIAWPFLACFLSLVLLFVLLYMISFFRNFFSFASWWIRFWFQKVILLEINLMTSSHLIT